MGKKKIKGSRPKQYHYVPRRYLKRFVGPDGKLTVYDKGREQFRTHQDPRKVMRRKNYYRQEHAPENADKDILEKESAEFLEPKAISAVDKICCRQSLNDDDVAMLIAYLEFQKIRTPREANWAFAVMHQFLKSSIYSNPALIKAKQAMESGLVKLTIKDHARFEYLRNMTGFFFKFLPYMRWEVMVAPDKCPYIVSDHPVTMFNPSAQPLAQPGYVSEEAGLIRTDPGIGLAGTRILFPLDTKHLLMISHLVYPTRITDPLARLSYDEMQEEMLIPFSYVDATCQFVTDINYVIFQCAHTLVAGPSKEPIQKALSGKGIEFREIYARC